MKSYLLVISFFLFNCTYAQLVTSTAQSPSALVQNVLLGSGVTVSNIQYFGAANSIGSFTAAGTNLGIPSGIIMTTGTVVNTGDGPQGPNTKQGAGVDNSAGGYPPLTNLINGTSTFNSSVLEFDFVPYSDTVRFKYSFGSEEYPEYVGSQYNDVFAFFISGPGISGQQNIAKLPNNGPVTINNVNAGSNSAYFVSNGDGNTSPYNSSATYLQYDGYTTVLEAVSKVECGQTYHLVIAIADAGDAAFDSGIFLEANSLNSKIPVEISYDLSFQAFGADNILAEGCVSSDIILERSGNISSALTIPVNVSGSATQGVDYSAIPATVTFPAGQSQAQFTFNALADMVVEGLETVVLSFPITDPCGNQVPIVLNLAIDDIQPLAVSVQSADVLCPGQPLEVLAVVSGGSGPYVYAWNTNETTSSIFVSPASTATYTVSVTDNCLHETVTASGTIVVPIYPPIDLIATPDIVEICPYIPAILEVTASGGAGNFTYEWTATEPPALGTASTQEVIPHTTTTYMVEVKDQCGESKIAYIVYTITSPPLELTMSPDIEICPGDSTLISVSSIGGYGQHYYDWKHNRATTPAVWVQPSVSTTYTVSVSDDCQTFSVEDSVKVTIVAPTADFTLSSHTVFNNLPITFQNLTENGNTYLWDFGDGNTSTLVHPNNTFLEPGAYIVKLIAYDEKGCIDSIKKQFTIPEEYYVYIPNTFTPDNNRFNNDFQVSTIGIQKLSIVIFNRWGQLVFQSDDQYFRWDGTYNAIPAMEDVYTYIVHCVTNEGIRLDFEGHVLLLK